MVKKIGVGPLFALFIILVILFKGDPIQQFETKWIYLLIILFGSLVISAGIRKTMQSVAGDSKVRFGPGAGRMMSLLAAILIAFAVSEVIWGYIPKTSILYLILVVVSYAGGVLILQWVGRAEKQ